MPERGAVTYRRHNQHGKRERCDHHHSDNERSPRRIKQASNGRDPESGKREREQRADHVTPFAIACLTLRFRVGASHPRKRDTRDMSGGYSAISSYSRVEILHQLQERSQRTIAELCDSTGLHPNTVREHLQRLVDGGHVVIEREERQSRGRPRMLYSAATGAPGASSPIARARVRDAAERGDLMRRVLPGESGNLDADAQHQIDAIVDDLVDAGFEPLVDEDELTIDLTPCPHASDPAHQRATLCSVHLGIMQSVLTEAQGPLLVEGMAPSCDPAQCVVHLVR